MRSGWYSTTVMPKIIIFFVCLFVCDPGLRKYFFRGLKYIFLNQEPNQKALRWIIIFDYKQYNGAVLLLHNLKVHGRISKMILKGLEVIVKTNFPLEKINKTFTSGTILLLSSQLCHANYLISLSKYPQPCQKKKQREWFITPFQRGLFPLSLFHLPSSSLLLITRTSWPSQYPSFPAKLSFV